jgi:MraZ protein
MFFVGTYELTIDAKNRLSIPLAVREKMNTESEGRAWYVVPGRRQKTLAIYPERYFESRRKEYPGEEQLSDEAYEWRQFEYSQTALVDPDSQGRVLIPERLLNMAGIQRDVALIGMQDHLELWNRAELEEFQKERWPKYPAYRARAMSEMKELNGHRGETDSRTQ